MFERLISALTRRYSQSEGAMAKARTKILTATVTGSDSNSSNNSNNSNNSNSSKARRCHVTNNKCTKLRITTQTQINLSDENIQMLRLQLQELTNGTREEIIVTTNNFDEVANEAIKSLGKIGIDITPDNKRLIIRRWEDEYR